jgi:Tripartite tricarboxylate transporter family receptor/Type VI secretion system effector, Hcp
LQASPSLFQHAVKGEHYKEATITMRKAGSGTKSPGKPETRAEHAGDKLNAEINAALADPKMRARLAELGGTSFANSPTDFVKFVADDTAKWAKVIRAANIKPQ